MKKLLIAALCCLPITLIAQFSIVPSGSVGMSTFKLEYKNISDFKADVAFTGDVLVRYSIPNSYFYASTGVGFLSYKSNNDAEPIDAMIPPPEAIKHAYLSESLNALYFPLYIGFYLPEKELSPVIEVGGVLNTVLSTGDFSEQGKYEENSTMFSFVVGAGLRYKLYKNNALEVKLRYTQTNNMLELSGSRWTLFSLNVGYFIVL